MTIITTSPSEHIDFNTKFSQAYDLLENSLNHIFITGKAGTGKSTLLQYFRDHTSKNVIVVAPTGVAAVNVRGQTIHSFFRFKPDITPDSVSSIKIRRTQRQIYENIDALIIDEVSMVRADLFDCMDAFLRLHGKNKKLPFGGVQMILFGDLYQLPPVVTRYEAELFNGTYSSPYFFSANAFKDLAIDFVELDKIYRQQEEEFIRLLGDIRNKTITEDHLKKLNKRFIPNFAPDENDFYVYLTSTNVLADQINEQKLQQLKSKPYRHDGDVTGKFEIKNLPTHERLNVKFGAQVMLLNNDSQGRWVNGSIGKIISTREEEKIIRVELDDGRQVDVTPHTWEMFRFFYNEDTDALESESIGSFTQYPLKLAWAITIHKSQGKTFSKVIIDIGYGTFAHGQAYVALSRCSSFNGLVLRKPIQRQHILLDGRIVDFMSSRFDKE